MSSEDTTDNAAAVAAAADSSGVAAKTNNWVQFEDETEPKGATGPAEGKAANSGVPAVIKPESVTVQVDKIGKSIDAPDVNDKRANEYRGAVIATESVQINLDRSGLSRSITSETPDLKPPDVRVEAKSASLKTIDLRDVSNGRNASSNVISTSIGNIRQGFANGDTIVTLLPVNTKWPWITPARFRPELVPEELMAQGLTVRVIHHILFSSSTTLQLESRFPRDKPIMISQFRCNCDFYGTDCKPLTLDIKLDIFIVYIWTFPEIELGLLLSDCFSIELTLQFIKLHYFNMHHNFIFINITLSYLRYLSILTFLCIYEFMGYFSMHF